MFNTYHERRKGNIEKEGHEDKKDKAESQSSKESDVNIRKESEKEDDQTEESFERRFRGVRTKMRREDGNKKENG